MINRAAIILKYKPPFVDWYKKNSPEKSPEVTLESVNTDRTVYLVSNEDADVYDQWIDINFQELFENELDEWFSDTSLWPQDRTRVMFDDWFEVECHTVMFDTVGEEIIDDETD